MSGEAGPVPDDVIEAIEAATGPFMDRRSPSSRSVAKAAASALGVAGVTDAYAGMIAESRTAARLRSLATRMDSHLNRGRSFTGAEVAAMLRDGDQ